MNSSLPAPLAAAFSAPGFWFVAVLGVGLLTCSVVAITRRTALGAALAMVAASLFGAGLFSCLSAAFLATAWVLVTGLSMLVFFVFGVILLNRDDSDPVALRSLFLRALAWAASWTALLFVVQRLRALARLEQPAESSSIASAGTAAVGQTLYSTMALPAVLFAALLTISLVGALSLCRVIAAPRDKDLA